MLSWGPQALPQTQRMAIAHEIAERVKERFHLEVFAVGLYGSLARGEDGPYSDIELFGVLRTGHYKHRYEWCTAEWKAEVDLYGKQTLLERAARVDDRWPLTHGALQTVLPLYDPEQFFAEIRKIAQSRTAVSRRHRKPACRGSVRRHRQNPQCPGVRNSSQASGPCAEACPGCGHGRWFSEPILLYHGNTCHLGSDGLARSARWVSRTGPSDPKWRLT